MAVIVTPSFSSRALDEPIAPDWADVVLEPIPVASGALKGPAEWAYEVFRPQSMPAVVRALMAVRQLLVPLIGVSPADPSTTFRVTDVVGDEALIVAPDRHLDFRCGVGFDPDSRLLRVTTAVWFHGWRGRLYFVPVRLLHDPVTRSMMRRAIRRTVDAHSNGARPEESSRLEGNVPPFKPAPARQAHTSRSSRSPSARSGRSTMGQ